MDLTQFRPSNGAPSRRRFLWSAARMPGGVALAGDRTLLADMVERLPTVRFGKHEITRLIVGSGPLYGHSHAATGRAGEIMDQLIRAWSTTERVCHTLHACEQNGINTYQGNARERSVTDLARYRAEGGMMHMISLATGDVIQQVVEQVKPIGMAHHGEVTDRLFREGKLQEVHEFTKRVRQTGLMVGISTHQPETIARIEELGWDVDFYMGCAYNRTRTPEQLRTLLGDVPEPPSEVYLRGDPARMFQVMRKTTKPCLVFKILAAGRVTGSTSAVQQAFRTAFESIKPQDCVIVGMCQRFRDEVTENVGHVRQLLSGRRHPER